MNIVTILLILGAIVVLLVAAKLMVLVVPLLFVVVPILHLLLAAAGLYSCLTSNKPTNTKLLWVIIIVLAPLLGPLLWFFWGRKNT